MQVAQQAYCSCHATYGYKQVESYEGDKGMFWGLGAKGFKKQVDDLGMTLISSHCNIEKDFEHSIIGIKKLPQNSKSGVYTAYLYYLVLLNKIKKAKVKDLMSKRIRVSNFHKLLLLLKAKSDISLKRI